MCEEICIPGGADVSLITADRGRARRRRRCHLGRKNPHRNRWPAAQPTRAWTATAERARRKNDHAHPYARDKPTRRRSTPKERCTFSPRTASSPTISRRRRNATPDGAWVLALPIASDGPADAKKLLGVVTSDGRLAAGRGAARLARRGGHRGRWRRRLRGGEGRCCDGRRRRQSVAAGDALASLPGTLAAGVSRRADPQPDAVRLSRARNQDTRLREPGRAQATCAVVMHGVVFTLGVLLSFWSLAGALAGAARGWRPARVGVSAAVGAVRLRDRSADAGVCAEHERRLRVWAARDRGRRGKLQAKDGYAGSFFTGVLATVVATPCSAPFLAPALGHGAGRFDRRSRSPSSPRLRLGCRRRICCCRFSRAR